MSKPKPEMTVRSGVLLTAQQHDELVLWQRNAALKLGRARVTRQEIFVAFVERLLKDKKLSDEIVASL